MAALAEARVDQWSGDHADWLADGLVQRCHLLASLLADWHGAQTTLACEAVPRAFVFGHPAFLHPRSLPSATPVLTRVEADLTWCPDGEWRVRSQRTAAAAEHPISAVLEAPGLAPFLPALCRRLLGETLRLGSTPSLSLTDPNDRARARAADARWVLRDAYDPAAPPIIPAELSFQQRANLQHAVSHAPWRFVLSMNHPEARTRLVKLVSGPGGWRIVDPA